MRIAITIFILALVLLCSSVILSEIGVIIAKIFMLDSPLGDVVRLAACIMVLITLVRALFSKSTPPG